RSINLRGCEESVMSAVILPFTPPVPRQPGKGGGPASSSIPFRASFGALALFSFMAFVPATALAQTSRPESPAPDVPWRSSCGATSAQPQDEIDRIALRVLDEQHIPGLSIAIIRDNRVMKIASYGWSDLERCVPVTPESVFGLGSVSKQFTAVGILTLTRDGKLSLDDPIVKFLPEGAGTWQGIRIRHLLTHTSGIKDYCGDDRTFESMKLDRTSNIATSNLVAKIAEAPLNFKAGDHWAYSNTGYVLLSIIAERVSGLPFPEFMRRTVFVPAGME